MIQSKTLKQRGYACIGLDNPKDPLNVGSALRAVGIYQAAMIAITGKRYRKSKTDTMKAHRHQPLLHVENLKDVIPYDCVPVAVDILKDAAPLPLYQHPDRAFYIFGSEDSTLGDGIISWCRDKIYIPGNRCMNLAAAINVVLYDRMSKQFSKTMSVQK